MQNESFVWRPKWFLITRFLAVAGVAAALVFSYLIGIRTIDYIALIILVALLLLSNLAYTFFYSLMFSRKRFKSEHLRLHLAVFTVVQINTDLVILTLMLHFSGGATNPFVFYYFFHPMLASILLSRPAAYTEAVIAAMLFSAMTILEGAGMIPHYDLLQVGWDQPLFVVGICFAMISALLIEVYFATSITDRLRQQQRELEYAFSEMERLEDEKSRFLDVVAHDLKTPITSIETMAASNLQVFGEQMPEPVRRTLERIPVRTGQLLKLVQELLDFSRIRKLDEVQLEFKPLNFLPIVAATVEMYMPEAMERNITVKLSTDPQIPTIMGNKNHLERMVSNLISNAVRYTPNGGTVNVKISGKDGEVILTVADTGIGIPEEDIPHIFDNFFRAKNARRMDPSGTGLGLSIIKAIAEKHHGAVTFTSSEGEGTVFTVKLPAAPSPS